MKSVQERAYGKLNLTLDVLGKRDDGYHDMCMIMQTVSLSDLVTVTLTEEDGWVCSCDHEAIPQGGKNLAWKAAEAFFEAYGKRPEHLLIDIQKQIPVQGGMAGGSADAAAVLRALNVLHGTPYTAEELADIGSAVGSDVPYCVIGGTALAEGRGEIISKLPPLPDCYFVLVKPEFSVSTPALFKKLDESADGAHPDTQCAIAALQKKNLHGLCRCMTNVFQPVLSKDFPVIDEICARLVDLGAERACLTGTGSVVFGVFTQRDIAEDAVLNLSKDYTVFLAENV